MDANGTETDWEPTAEESRPLAELRRIAGGRCIDCRALYSAFEAVESIVLGFKNAVRCRTCLAARLNVDPAELRERLSNHIQRRDCFRIAWQAAIEMDRHPPVDWTTTPDVPDGPPAESSGESWDAGDLGCGELVMGLRMRLERLPGGALFHLQATDSAAPEDIPAWCRLCGHVLVAGDHPHYVIRRKGG